MDIRKTRTCERCKAVVLLEKIRLFPKNKEINLVVCEPCCEELKKTTQQKTPTLSSKVKPLPPAEYGNYHCKKCVYDFRVDLSKAGITYNVHCPYCGLSDYLMER